MVEYIHAMATIDGGEGLLAIVLRNKDASWSRGRQCKFYTEPNNPLQLGFIRYGPHDEVKPHAHIPCKRTTEQTQEVLFVRYGSITVTIYDGMGNVVKSVTLTRGECILLIAGGHSLQAYDNAEIIEVKNGPYIGREQDKVEFPNE
jgi:hypothetical protein